MTSVQAGIALRDRLASACLSTRKKRELRLVVMTRHTEVVLGMSSPKTIHQPRMPAVNTPVARVEVAPANNMDARAYCRLRTRYKPEKVQRAYTGSVYGEDSTAGVGGIQ